ncbi:MAG: restriction endonuclease, SacI family [Treponema sp.]|nr:restriction endonuclease, SacI family [Treponema sp.]
MTEATTAYEYPRGVTPEEVWAMMRENAKEADRRLKETERLMDRLAKEADERQKKTEKEIAALSKNVGGLNRSFGELLETLIAARLWEKFSAYPYNLRRAYQRVPLFDENSRVLTDIDILLADGEWVMAVEVKRESTKKDDVDHHIRRMDLIRKYPPAETVGKKLLGAFACGVIDPDVRDYAHAAGFFVLELKGEAVDLVPPPESFSPRQW